MVEEWSKKKEEPIEEDNPKVIRVLNYDDLEFSYFGGGSFWHSEYIKDPEVIGKIFDHLRTAKLIRLYVTRNYITYTAETKEIGQVSGRCLRCSDYDFFKFGIMKSGHRFDIYGEDRNDPTIKAFYQWWENLVKLYEEAFDKDFNL